MLQHRIRIKMCGMTRREDVDQALWLGVDAIGLVFSAESPRYVTLDEADNLLIDLPPFVTAVAVLVNPEPSFVRELLIKFPFLTLQFHGDESAAFCEQFYVPYIKSVSVQRPENIMEALQEYGNASALLLDSREGGSGIAFDWGQIPGQMNKSWILAGGLNADNVQIALKQCNPWAVDVCSGIESSKGIKDINKMRAFVKACNIGAKAHDTE